MNSGSINIRFPESTPDHIKNLIAVASKTRFCNFSSNLSECGTPPNYYEIQAKISSSSRPIGELSSVYTVKFVIPRKFPYLQIDVVPIDPPLKWFPHQDGDWSISPIANRICPPDKKDSSEWDSLTPYIRHAYDWLEAALGNSLVHDGDRYEFPQIISRNQDVVYIEGGEKIYSWIKKAQYGLAWVNHITGNGKRVYIARKLQSANGIKDWDVNINSNVFGKEMLPKCAPWIFVGNPVESSPHKPYLYWRELPLEIKKRLIEITQRDIQLPFLLLAFEVPDERKNPPSKIVWYTAELPEESRREAREGDLRLKRISAVKKLDIHYLQSDESIIWGECTDVSNESLKARIYNEQDRTGEISIALVGVGAIGSVLAKSLSKLNSSRVLLLDCEKLEPGNLIRHEGLSFQVEQSKAGAIASIIEPIYRDHELVSRKGDIIRDESLLRELSSYSIIIDASANTFVHKRIANTDFYCDKTVIFVFIKPGPNYGFIFIKKKGSNLTLKDAESGLLEKLKPTIRDEFNSRDANLGGLVWPVPGCYHPTFKASYHRVRMMGDTFLSIIESYINYQNNNSIVTLIKQKESKERIGIETFIESQVILE